MIRPGAVAVLFTCWIVYASLCVHNVTSKDIYVCGNNKFNCECTKKEVVCADRNLTSIPVDMPLTAEYIEIIFSGITEIPNNFFLQFKDLKKLTLSNNNIRKPFNLPGSITSLILSYNKLTEIGEMLYDLANLEELYLDQNNLTDIPAGTFKDCKRLNYLELSSNRLKQIRRDMFYAVAWPSDMSIIVANMSTLSYIEEDALVDIGNSISMFDISDCNLTEIPRNVFANCTTLQSINLINNKLTSLPGGLFKQCSEHFTMIRLRGNRLTTLPALTFQGVRGIDLLDLRGNQLVELPEDLLLNTTVLETMDISGNRLKRLHPHFFHGRLPISLFMYGNELEALPKELFKSRDCNIKQLLIFNNKIRTIEDFAFQHCASLTLIYAFSNQLTNITKNTFVNKGRTIVDLNIIQNPVKSVENGAFDILNPSAKLYMSCEDLTLLPTFLSNSTEAVCVQPSTMKLSEFAVVVGIEPSLGMNGHGFECKVIESTYSEVNCTPCKPGFYGEGKDIDMDFADEKTIREACKPVPKGGFYQDKIGQVKLERCNPGAFIINGKGTSIADCEVCPSGTNTSRFAEYRACSCVENFHRIDRFGECFICNQTGILCTNEYQQLRPGYWWSWNASRLDKDGYKHFIDNIVIKTGVYDNNTTAYHGMLPLPYLCLNPDACLGSNATDVIASCAEGYSSEYPLCSVCTKDYYKWSTTCRKCPELYVTFLIYGALITVIALIIVSVYVYRKKFNREGRTVADVILARFKICIGFYQVLSGLLEALRNVRWPNGLVSLGNIFSFFELNFIHIASPRCIWEQLHVNAYVEFYMAIGIPLVVILIIILTYFIAKTCYRKSDTETCEEKSKSFKKECFRVAVLILFTMYPVMCSKIFAILPPSCRIVCAHHNQTNCPSFLKNDYSISCTDNSYIIHKVVSIVMAVGVAGILPAALLFLLMKVRPTKTRESNTAGDSQVSLERSGRNLTNFESESGNCNQSRDEIEENVSEQSEINDERPADESNGNNTHNSEDDGVLKYGLRFLYENYTDKCWYWEVLEIVRKLLLTSVILFFGAKSKMQIGFAMVSSIIFLLLHGSFQPMKNKLEFWLQVISLGAIATNLSIGVLLLVPEGTMAPGVDIPTDSLAINVFMYVINGWIILVVIGAYLASVGKSCVALYKHPQCNCECCIAFILPTQHFIHNIENCSHQLQNHARLACGSVQAPPTHGSLKPKKSVCPCWGDQSDSDIENNDAERERLIPDRAI